MAKCLTQSIPNVTVTKRTELYENNKYYWNCPRCDKESSTFAESWAGGYCGDCNRDMDYAIREEFAKNREELFKDAVIDYVKFDDEHDFTILYLGVKLRNGMYILLEPDGDDYATIHAGVEDPGDVWDVTEKIIRSK